MSPCSARSSFQQVSYWINSYTLFQHAAEVTNNNWFAYNHIGIAFDKDAKAITTLDPQAADALFDHVTRYFARSAQDPRRAEVALAAQRLARRVTGRRSRSSTAGRKQELLFDYSADNFKAAIDIKPDYDFGNNNLGVYYAHPGPSQDLG